MTVEHQAKVFSALSDPVRLGLVHELKARGQACGTDLSQALGISLSLVCHHAKILVEAGLVAKAKAGTTAVYTLETGALRDCLGSFETP